MKERIYQFDNAKAILIFLVVIGHMTSDYVSDSYLVRAVTLWIYLFHMPAFIFLSGLVHKRYIAKEKASLGFPGETRLRLDKVIGFFLCGYALKVFLQLTRTLMGQHPAWSWYREPGIPWYLFVMAAYELIFYLMRHIDGKIKPRYVIIATFVLSAGIGYVPFIGDAFCLSRMINFLPIYALGYYAKPERFLEIIDKMRYKIIGALILIGTFTACCLGPYKMYGLRKWFTGRRTYEFMAQYFPNAVSLGWLYRIGIWAIALLIAFSLIAVIPNKRLGYLTTIGSRTLNVYFWHRPVCYLFRSLALLPRLFMLFGGNYVIEKAGTRAGLAFQGSGFSMGAAFLIYLIIGAAMTMLFSLKIFEHPCADLMKLGKLITRGKKDKGQ